MGLLFNFKTSKPRQFNYRPMYYDERKERLEKMKARATAEITAEGSGVQYTRLQKGFLTDRRRNPKSRRAELKDASNMRVLRYLIILVLILGLFYILTPDLFLAFWKIK